MESLRDHLWLLFVSLSTVRLRSAFLSLQGIGIYRRLGIYAYFWRLEGAAEAREPRYDHLIGMSLDLEVDAYRD